MVMTIRPGVTGVRVAGVRVEIVRYSYLVV